MIKTLKTLTFFSAIMFLMCGQTPAADTIRTDVRVIHASSGPLHVDPGLRDIGPELRSIFKYTSYKLLKDSSMNLSPGTRGRVILPQGRILQVLPLGIKGGRIKYNIEILKQGSRVFGTEILLRNHSSITIGGPDFEKGYLLLNISGATN